jgi:hypothetical protein
MIVTRKRSAKLREIRFNLVNILGYSLTTVHLVKEYSNHSIATDAKRPLDKEWPKCLIMLVPPVGFELTTP